MIIITTLNENFTRRKLVSSPDLYFLVDNKGKLLKFNGNEDLLYLPPKAFLGKTINEVLPKKVAQMYEIAIKETCETKEPTIFDYSLPLDDGLHYYEAIILYISESQAAIYVKDNTKQRKTEQKFKESEEKFRTITEQSLMGILIVQDNIVQYVNEAYANIFGYTVEDMMNWELKDAFNAIHPEDREFALEQLAKKQRGDKDIVKNYQYRGIKKSGEIIWVDQYSKPIIFKGKTADLITIVNISERKKIEQNLRESEDKYKNLFEKSPIAYTLINLNGIIIDCNSNTVDLFGYTKQELIGKHVIDVFSFPHPYDQLISDMFRSLQLGKIPNAVEFQTYSKEGDIIWTLLIISLIEMGNEQIIMVAEEDITERKKAEQKLVESEELYRTLTEGLSQTGIGIDIIDSNYNIIYQNQLLREQFGEHTNRKCFNFYLGRKDRCENCPMIRAITNKTVEKEIMIASNNHTYEILSAPLPNPSGTIDRVAEVIVDISEKIEVEKRSKKLSKLKSELLTRTSHELKTPALHIKGYTDLLLHKYKDNLGIDELQIISTIKKGVLRLETLIYDIMHKAELDSGEGELNKVSSNLSSLIELSVKELRSFAALRGHSIKLNIDDNIIVKFDEEQIRHVLNNLITNAIKYTPLNGIIGINSTITDDSITIAVQDNGIGLTEKQISRLFTPFGKIERYGQGFDIITEGSGLGLHIAKKIIDLHGGRIWVESGGINKGSTFYFSLPKVLKDKFNKN
ncbi:MAG: PAS domain S-box protein [Promethearchaeota archaeon]